MVKYTSFAMNASKKDDLKKQEAIVIIICLFNAPMMLISVFGNSVVLAAILRTPSPRSPSVVFLGGLAVSDFLRGWPSDQSSLQLYLTLVA